MRRVTVLYEDSAGLAVKEFGPHNLLLQCVADMLNREVWSLRNVLIAEPKNGVNKLLNTLEKDMNDLARGDGRVFALIDKDDIAEHLTPKLPKTACRTLIVRQIKHCHCPSSPDRLEVVLLENNLEDLLVCLRQVQPSLTAPETWTLAIKNKKTNERDRILNSLAKNPSHKDLRAALLEQFPSFARLVTRVARIVA